MSSSIKFLIDMPLSPRLAAWLIQRGHDAVHAQQWGLAQASDAAIMQQARQEHRIIVTADLDFPRLFALMHVEGPGLVLLRGGNYSDAQAKELLDRVLTVIPLQELSHALVVVDHTRIRKTHLPL